MAGEPSVTRQILDATKPNEEPQRDPAVSLSSSESIVLDFLILKATDAVAERAAKRERAFMGLVSGALAIVAALGVRDFGSLQERAENHQEKIEARISTLETDIRSQVAQQRELVEQLQASLASSLAETTVQFSDKLDSATQSAEDRLVGKLSEAKLELRSNVELESQRAATSLFQEFSRHASGVLAEAEQKAASATMDVESQVRLLALMQLGERLDTGVAFTSAERDEGVETIEALVPVMRSASPTSTMDLQQTYFWEATKKVLGSLAAADQQAQLDDLHDHVATEFAKQDDIVETMLQHYGRRLLAAPFPEPETRRRFEVYYQAADRNSGMRGAAECFDLVARYDGKAEQRDSFRKAVGLVGDDPEAAKVFVFLLRTLQDEKRLSRMPTESDHVIASRARAFGTDFRTEIAALEVADATLPH